MSTTLSRRIRRIGILPTTFRTSTEVRLVKEIENGKKVEVKKEFTIRTPIRNREVLNADERNARAEALVTEFVQKHRTFREKRRQARQTARAASLAKRTAPKSSAATAKKK